MMHTYASHDTCEHLQILSTSKVLGIQNLGKPVPSGSNVNVYTVISYIHMHIHTYVLYMIISFCIQKVFLEV